MNMPSHAAAHQLQVHPPVVDQVQVRALASRDSLAALTHMLNRAYAPLLARGMNFTASTQDVDTTRRRAADGLCLVADSGGVVVGTVTACGPYDEREVGTRAEVPWYREPDIAHLQRFGVDPAYQRQGGKTYRWVNMSCGSSASVAPPPPPSLRWTPKSNPIGGVCASACWATRPSGCRGWTA